MTTKTETKPAETETKPHINPFVQIDRRVARDPKIPATQKALYLVLKSYSWQDGHCYPSQETLASDLNFSDRTIRTWLKDLEKYGLIKIVQQGMNEPNIYYLKDINSIYKETDRKSQVSENKTDRKPQVKPTGSGFPPTNKHLTNTQYICQPEAANQNQETPPADSSTESESPQEPAELTVDQSSSALVPAQPESPPASPDPSAGQQSSTGLDQAPAEPESPPEPAGSSAARQIKKARKIPGKRGYKYPAQFEEFWQAYPRSNGKRPAYLKWEKLVINKKTPPEEILEAAANYRDLCQLEGRRQKFMLHPRTFLGPSDHWVDYLNSELEATGQLATLEAARKRNQGQAGRSSGKAGQKARKPGQQSTRPASPAGAKSRRQNNSTSKSRARAATSAFSLPPVRAMPADLAREIDQELIEIIKSKNQSNNKNQSKTPKGAK